MKLISLVLVAIFIGAPAKKPAIVILEEKLLKAHYASYVEITGYKDSTILFKPIAGSERFYSMRMSDAGEAIFQPYTRDGQHAARAPFVNHRKVGDQLNGYWPVKGEKVLIVLDSASNVSLFAYKENQQYRFWSPTWATSSPVFRFRLPATRLAAPLGLSDSSSFDGCLLPVNRLTTYGRENKRATYSGRAMHSGGDALLIYDYADSQPFTLDGIDKWDAKYLDKHLEVEGILVSFVNGNSVIKDWKIISVK